QGIRRVQRKTRTRGEMRMSKSAPAAVVAEDIVVQVIEGVDGITSKALHVNPKFNYMPPLSTHDYERLRESIDDTKGLLSGLEVRVDENDDIIDGHHRARICSELGLICAIREFTGSEQDKLDYVWKTNVPRRHLTIEE